MPPPASAFIKRIKHILPDVKKKDDLRGYAARFGHSEITRRQEIPNLEVNSGRWLARCPVCSNGILADPDWEEAVCFECGNDYVITAPPPQDVNEIERLLLKRPKVGTQNWIPGETLEELEADNRNHGVEEIS
jgi:hypothetical protein